MFNVRPNFHYRIQIKLGPDQNMSLMDLFSSHLFVVFLSILAEALSYEK